MERAWINKGYDIHLGPIKVKITLGNLMEESVSYLKDLRDCLSWTVVDCLGELELVLIIVEEDRKLLLVSEGGVVSSLLGITDIDEGL